MITAADVTVEQLEYIKSLGNEAFKARDFTEALKLYDEGIELSGLMYIENHRPANRTSELCVDFLLNKAAAYLELKDFARAKDEAQRMLVKMHEHPRALERVGKANMGLKKYADAIFNFESLQRVQPSDATLALLAAARAKLAQATAGGAAQVAPLTVPVRGVAVTNIKLMKEVVLQPGHPALGSEVEVSPVLMLAGIGLRVYKVAAGSPSYRDASLDNEVACYVMIDEGSGFAPQRWQYNVGQVIMTRTDGADLSVEDVYGLWDYFNKVLDLFGDGPEQAHSFMTPKAFRRWLKRYNEQQREFNEKYKNIAF